MRFPLNRPILGPDLDLETFAAPEFVRKIVATYLTLKIPPPPNQEHQHRYTQERRPEGFAHLLQVVCVRRVAGGQAFALGDGGVEAEELCDCYAD